ncbi:hypothetical protein, partial [Lawsonibacter hominis]|uniref:hypothetical protein n=1 Tax=Lawsonibacter hominis TaxID=2763053 RepID=UPI001A9AB5B1
DMVYRLLSEWCVATSFYQSSANHVSFYPLLYLRNLFYLIKIRGPRPACAGWGANFAEEIAKQLGKQIAEGFRVPDTGVSGTFPCSAFFGRCGAVRGSGKRAARPGRRKRSFPAVFYGERIANKL